MITGAHAIIYSRDPEADRTFLRDLLGLPHVDVGGGWLIFGLPPAEVAVHPTDDGGRHELYLICEDVQSFVAMMRARNVACAPITDQRWGLLTSVELPGGGKLGVYEARHARPPEAGGPPATSRTRPTERAKSGRPASKLKTAKKKAATKAAARPSKAKRRR
jgi:hypothetical protein